MIAIAAMLCHDSIRPSHSALRPNVSTVCKGMVDKVEQLLRSYREAKTELQRLLIIAIAAMSNHDSI